MSNYILSNPYNFVYFIFNFTNSAASNFSSVDSQTDIFV